MVINRPLPNIVAALDDIALELDRLQGLKPPAEHGIKFLPEETAEKTDVSEGTFRHKPAHFTKKTFGVN